MKLVMAFIILILSAIILYLLFWNKPNRCSASPPSTSSAFFATPLDTAQACIKRYVDMTRKYLGDSTPVRAYTIRSVDLLETLGIPMQDTICAKYTHIRAYIGMNYNNDFKLFLTPVIDANLTDSIPGIDVILDGKFKTIGYSESASAGQYVIDLIAPCPNSCDTRSALYIEN